MINPSLVTYFGNEDLDDSYGLSGEDLSFIQRAGIKTARILHKWPKLSARQKALMYKRHPELMGVIPIPLIAAIGKGVVSVGKKVVGAVKRKADAKKKAKEKAATEQAQQLKIKQETEAKAAQDEINFKRQLELEKAKSKADTQKVVMSLLPVAAIAAVLLLKKGKK